MEVRDCSIGILGSVLEVLGAMGVIGSIEEYGGALECEWKQYRFPKPIARFGVDSMGLGVGLRKELKME